MGQQRVFAWLCTGLLCTLAAFVAVVADGDSALANRTIWVAPGGSDTANGSSSSPLRTITHAVNVAASGDTVMVRSGVYNESVQVYRKAVHIQSAPGEWAALDGTQRLGGFNSDGAGRWYVSGWTRQFSGNTGPMVDSSNRAAGYPDQVFYDGQPLRQVLSRSAVASGTFYHDTAADQIWLADNPNGHRVDASNAAWGVYFNDADGSSLTNMSVRRYATPHTALGAIRAYSDNILISGVIVEHNAYMGISVIGRNVTIRDSRINNNGYIGVHANQAEQLVIDSSSITSNNTEGFDPLHSAAGVKATTSSAVVVRHSEVRDNDGPGVWFDISSSNVQVVGNVVTGNSRSGIEVELTNGAIIAGNVSSRNGEAGIWVLESQNVEVWHNTVFDNEREIYVLEGPRRDVSNVHIRNNVIGRPTGSSLPLLSVDDWTENRSAAQMNVTGDSNTYWRRSSAATPHVSRWARWPQSLALNRTMSEQVSATGSGTASIETSSAGGLPVENLAASDYRGDSTVTMGAPLPANVAAALGVSGGTQLRSGSVIGGLLPANDAPSTRLVTSVTNSSVSADGYRHAVRVVDLTDF